MFGLIEKKRNSMLAFLELTPRLKKLKRRASLEFCVHLDMSQIGIVSFTKLCVGFSKFRILKKLSRFYFFQWENQAKESCEKDFKTMKNENFKIPRHRFVEQTIPIRLISKWTHITGYRRVASYISSPMIYRFIYIYH